MLIYCIRLGYNSNAFSQSKLANIEIICLKPALLQLGGIYSESGVLDRMTGGSSAGLAIEELRFKN